MSPLPLEEVFVAGALVADNSPASVGGRLFQRLPCSSYKGEMLAPERDRPFTWAHACFISASIFSEVLSRFTHDTSVVCSVLVVCNVLRVA